MRWTLMPLVTFMLLIDSAALGFATGTVQLVQIASGLSQPLAITHAGDGSGRLFIVERIGRIRIVENGTLLAPPFLDISDRVVTGSSEQGLLGLAFHPDYETNGRFYVSYTIDTQLGHPLDDGDSVVSRFVVSAGNANLADPASEDVLLTLAQPAGNHNGGQIEFGPDALLYAAFGDGGGGGDPFANGQNRATLLGALLRLDIDGDDFPGDPNRDYSIPPDNPFVGDPTAAPEIWAWGLRNPWRFSFDRCTGDLFIGDVGQGVWEEIDLESFASPGGVNYGWPLCEGAHEYAGSGAVCDTNAEGLEPPILEYQHGGSPFLCSVTGGFRYRGSLQPNLKAEYLFADFCGGTIWSARETAPDQWSSEVANQPPFNVASFGEGENGEPYVAAYNTGRVYWIDDAVDAVFVDGWECGATSWSSVITD